MNITSVTFKIPPLSLFLKRVRLTQFVDKYIKETYHSTNYKCKINSINNTLKEFELSLKRPLYTSDFTPLFCEHFVEFLQKKNLRNNTIRDLTRKINTLLNKAKEEGYAVRNSMKRVIPRYEVTQQIYLTEQELNKLFRLEGLTPRDEIIRDTFLIGCYTGLRRSNLLSLKRENINNDEFIIKKTSKTREIVTIPLHPVLREIFKKYNNEISPVSIQYYNQQIKKICEKAGITTPIFLEYYAGKKLIQKTVPKYSLVSMHTARRTVITNLYLQNVPLKTIMIISGHTTIEALMLYIRTSNEEHKRILANTSYFKLTTNNSNILTLKKHLWKRAYRRFNTFQLTQNHQ